MAETIIIVIGVIIIALILSGKEIIIGHVSRNVIIVQTENINVEVLSKDEENHG